MDKRIIWFKAFIKSGSYTTDNIIIIDAKYVSIDDVPEKDRMYVLELGYSKSNYSSNKDVITSYINIDYDRKYTKIMFSKVKQYFRICNLNSLLNG